MTNENNHDPYGIVPNYDYNQSTLVDLQRH